MQPNYYNMLDTKNVERIHDESLQVLKNTGLAVDHQEARKKLADAGARLEGDSNRVFISKEMVETALDLFPKSFICAGRTPDYDVTVTNSSNRIPCTRTVAGPLNIYDFSKNKFRTLTKDDCVEIARLVDGLPLLNMVSTLSPQDVPLNTYDIETLKVFLENGRKHIWALTTSSENLKFQMEMIEVVSGSKEELVQRPICSGIVCLIEPLFFPEDEVERLILYGKFNLPVRVPLAPMIGGNSPYTLAGTLVQTNAEALGSLVLLQTLCPGIPTWYYVIMESMDMRNGSLQMFNPEVMLLYNAIFQMARFYGLPAACPSGVGSDTQGHQIMFERGTSLISNALAGVSEIGAIGGLNNGMMISPELIVLDNEMFSFVRRFLEGFDINAETMALDAIHRQGCKGRFLEDDHTFQFLHREMRFKPMLFDWQPIVEQAIEEKTIFQRARDTLKKIQQTHEVPPLDANKQKELNLIMASANKALNT
jgi:trimethylamine--corrinoid protein Co-methyltransferase